MTLFKARESIRLLKQRMKWSDETISAMKNRIEDIHKEVFGAERISWIYKPRLAEKVSVVRLEEQVTAHRDDIKRLEERVVLLTQGQDELLYAIRAWMKETDGVEQRLTELEHDWKNYHQSVMAQVVQEDCANQPFRSQANPAGLDQFGVSPDVGVADAQENDEDARS